MRPELNDQIRKIFFFQYVNCCQCGDDGEEFVADWNESTLISFLEAKQEQAFLYLRPLSSITYEEAIEVADIVGLLIATKDKRKTLVDYLNNEMSREFESLGSHAVDYLRSKGFALPFMGYSVEELISAGFIKLTE